MKYIALVRNLIVESIVKGDDAFIELIKNNYDHVVDVTDRDRPSPGDSYYKDTDTFLSNAVSIIYLPVEDANAEHLKEGTEDGFVPFKLSKYSVSYDNGMVQIGCKKYSAKGLLDACHKVLVDRQQTVNNFTTEGGNPSHGKFDISWEDAELLYETLRKVRL